MSKEIIEYKSYKNQIEKIKSKNISIDVDEEIIENWLSTISYYTLINGYKHNFLIEGEKDIVKDGTTISLFYACKMIDFDLSMILLKYIQIIEQSLRTKVAYYVAENYTTDEIKYIDEQNYVNSKLIKKEKLVSILSQKRDNPNKNSYSYYFQSKNRSIPPWIIVYDLDFYDVISWYSCLNDSFRTNIRNEFINRKSNKDNMEFINAFNLLRTYRNIFAHSKRNFDSKINFKLNYHFGKNLKYGTILRSKDDCKNLLALLVILLSFLNDQSLETRLINELKIFLRKDGYVDEEYSGVNLFNGQTIYDILDLPGDFINKVEKII